MSLSPVDSGRIAIRGGRGRKALGETTGTSCMTSDSVITVLIGMQAVGMYWSREKTKEDDNTQADEHQLEGGLECNHDGESRLRGCEVERSDAK